MFITGVIVSILAGLLLLAGLLARVFKMDYYSETSRQEEKIWPLPVAVGVILVVIAGAVFGFGSATTVDPRNKAVVTVFGKFDSVVDSGFQWLHPAAKTEQFSTSRQFLDLDRAEEKQGDNDDNGVPITFKGGSTGTANAEAAWEMLEDDASVTTLWEVYKTFGKVSEKLVRGTISEQLRIVSSQYTPDEANNGVTLVKIKDEVRAKVETAFKDSGVELKTLVVTRYDLDKTTQDRINQTSAAEQRAKTAQADKARAQAEADANALRQKSLSKETLTQQCLELVDKALDIQAKHPDAKIALPPCNFFLTNNGTIVAPR